MDRRPILRVANILGTTRLERSWDGVPLAGYLRPAPSDRSQEIGDLGKAGLHIAAPARFQRGGRAAQPGGSSALLVRDSGELLTCTFSGSSARVDYQWRLEMNTQNSVEEVLFRQEMRYPERGAGGFSNTRRKGEESRAFPTVQLPEDPRFPLDSEQAPERGQSLLRWSPENRHDAGLKEDEAKAGVSNEGSGPASRGSVRHGLPPDAVRHFGDSRPGRELQ
jgi:hypothetical protein